MIVLSHFGGVQMQGTVYLLKVLRKVPPEATVSPVSEQQVTMIRCLL